MNFEFLESPIGTLRIISNGKGIVSIDKIETTGNVNAIPDKLTNQCKIQLLEYFDHRRRKFDVALDYSFASEFYQKVWDVLRQIPYGVTRSYGEIARALKNPNAVRAVGTANGKNPIPIIIPCHRVIGSDGSLVGYALGLEIKKYLLMHENPKGFGIQKQLF